jgi:hypothetical protein
MDDLNQAIKELSGQVSSATEKIGLDELITQRDELLKKMQEQDFWQDNKKAAELSKAYTAWYG